GTRGVGGDARRRLRGRGGLHAGDDRVAARGERAGAAAGPDVLADHAVDRRDGARHRGAQRRVLDVAPGGLDDGLLGDHRAALRLDGEGAVRPRLPRVVAGGHHALLGVRDRQLAARLLLVALPLRGLHRVLADHDLLLGGDHGLLVRRDLAAGRVGHRDEAGVQARAAARRRAVVIVVVIVVVIALAARRAPVAGPLVGLELVLGLLQGLLVDRELALGVVDLLLGRVERLVGLLAGL